MKQVNLNLKTSYKYKHYRGQQCFQYGSRFAELTALQPSKLKIILVLKGRKGHENEKILKPDIRKIYAK